MINLTSFLLYFILPVAAAIYYFLKKKFSYFESLGIPFAKPKWPMGNLHGSGSTKHMFELLMDVYEECKGKDVICGFYNFIQPNFVVIDPACARDVMVKDFNHFINRGGFVSEDKEPLTGEFGLIL